MKYRGIICLVLIGMASFCPAGEIHFTIETAPEAVMQVSNGIYTSVHLEDGYYPDNMPGSPHIPLLKRHILLPADARITSFSISEQNPVTFEGVYVYPSQPQTPTSLPEPDFAPPDPAIYSSSVTWPSEVGELGAIQHMRGYPFATLQLYPLRYQPLSRKLILHRRLDITIRYRIDSRSRASTVVRAPAESSIFRRMAQQRSANADLLETMNAPTRTESFRSGPDIDYLLITSAAYTNTFTSLITHRESSAGGAYATAVITTDSIYTNELFSGLDHQEEIRNCIRHYVEQHNTVYVSLGGSSGIVPDRDCRVTVGSYVVNNMPTDLYYSDLDGTWDADGDGTYGEAGDDAAEMDMLPDVIVGRIVINNSEQASNYVAKLIDYETNLADYNRRLGRKLFVGGKRLWTSYDGSPPADLCNDGHPEFSNRTSNVYDDEIWCRRMYRDMIRPWWEADTFRVFCDTMTSWDTTGPSNVGNHPASGTNMVLHINEEDGYAYTWIMTHGASTYWAMESGNFGKTQVAALTNLTPVVCTFACNTGMFDSQDALSEAYIRQPNGGALAYIGSSRYGWGSSASYYGGRSADFGNAFWACVFKDGALITGDAFAQHKADMAGSASYNGTARWLEFGINLQGDPAVPLPGQMPNLVCGTLIPDDSAGNNDGVANPSDRIAVTLNLENNGWTDAENVQIVASSTSSYVTIVSNTVQVGTVTARSALVTTEPFILDISPGCPTPHDIELAFSISDQQTNTWQQQHPLRIYESVSVTGQVTDSIDQPVSDVLIEYHGPCSGCYTTTADGRFNLTLGNGDYRIIARKAGYAKVPAQTITVPPATGIAFNMATITPAATPSAFTVSVFKCTASTSTVQLANSGNTNWLFTVMATEGALCQTNETGPQYAWKDISLTGTRIQELNADDAISSAIPIGFPFPFYGQTYSNLYVTEDGWMSFAEPTTALRYNNLLPSSYLSAAPMIAFFWDDLKFQKSGTAYYETRDNDTFILTFDGVPYASDTASTNTFQVILKSDGQVICQYQAVTNATSVTVGFQDTTYDGHGYSAVYNQTRMLLTNHTAIRLMHSCGAEWLHAGVPSGNIPADSNLAVALVFDSEGLQTGLYETVLSLPGNDSAGQTLAIPITMNVVGHATNHAPVAEDQLLTIDEDQFNTMIWPPEGLDITLTAHDDDGDALLWSITNDPAHGWYDGTPPNITYYPDSDYNGTDTIAFIVNDYETDSLTGTVSIVITPQPDAPWVWLTKPSYQHIGSTGTPFAVVASANDPDGDDNLDRVDFYAGGLLACSDSYDGDQTFSNDTTLAEGIYSLTGIAVDNDGLTATSSPVNVTIYSSLTAPWIHSDIGTPAHTGQAGQVAGNCFLMTGGSVISGTNDHFTFQYQSVSGEGSIQARLNAMYCADVYVVGGVMLRDELTESSPGAFMGVTGARDVQYGYRDTPGATSIVTDASANVPQWVRIDRTGEVIQAYYSSDGNTWTALGDPQTNFLNDTIYVGLASASATSQSTSHFDQVSIDFDGNAAPTVTIETPQGSPILLRPGDTLRLAGTASDDGQPNPPGALSTTWTLTSGPGQPTWNPAALTTTACFAQAGTYEIALQADDGQQVGQTSLTVYAAHVYDDLVAHWRFDETSGVTVADSSGSGRDASLNGGTWNPSGHIHGALSFTGGSQHADFSYPAITQMTMAAWIYCDGTATNTCLLSTPTTILAVENNSHRLRFRALYSTDEGSWHTPDHSITNGTWNYVQVYYDFASSWMTPEIYINGVFQTATSESTPRSPPLDNGGTGRIGNNPDLTCGFQGLIDDLRLYNRIIPYEDMTALSHFPMANIAPCVSIASTGTALIGSGYCMDSLHRDDGTPTDALYAWTQTAGTGTVGFASTTDTVTTLTFTNAGHFSIRLTADDGELISFSEAFMDADYDHDGDGTFDGDDPDDDNDGMPDDWEGLFGFNGWDDSDASLDEDHDGFSNEEEFIAATDPTNGLSYFMLDDCEESGLFYLEWRTATGRVYRIHHTPSGLNAWSNICEINGTGGTMVYTNCNTAPANGFFRVHVDLAP